MHTIQTETDNNSQQIASPPLPPAAVFDEQHMADARPVQPLPGRRWRKTGGLFQNVPGRRLTAIAAIVAALCIAVAAVTFNWQSPQAASEDTVQSLPESGTQPVALEPSGDSAMKNRERPRRRFSTPQVRESFPPLEINNGYDDRKTRPRLVTVIH